MRERGPVPTAQAADASAHPPGAIPLRRVGGSEIRLRFLVEGCRPVMGFQYEQ